MGRLKKMSEIKLGDFVRFNEKDAKGKFHYIGQVVEINEREMGFFTMDTFQGTMSFSLTDGNDLELCEKPVGWEKFNKNQSKYRHDLKDKEILKDVAPVVKTQKELIFDFVKLNKKLSQKKLLKLLKEEFPTVSDTSLSNKLQLALVKLG